MEFYIIRSDIFIMDKIGICAPCKVTYIGSYKMPSEVFNLFRYIYFRAFILVTMTYLMRILQIACGTYRIIFVQSNFYIKISPNTMKISTDIWVWMRTFE